MYSGKKMGSGRKTLADYSVCMHAHFSTCATFEAAGKHHILLPPPDMELILQMPTRLIT